MNQKKAISLAVQYGEMLFYVDYDVETCPSSIFICHFILYNQSLFGLIEYDFNTTVKKKYKSSDTCQ